MKFILFFLSFGISFTLSAQCTGTFGEPVFVQDFGYGTAGSYGNSLPAGYTTYIYRNFTNATPGLEDGEYTIATHARQGRTDWHMITDHSDDPLPNQGYMLLVNADYNPGEFYRERVNGLCAGQFYEVSFWVTNVLPPNVVPNPIPINVAFKLYDANGNLIEQNETGNINSTSTPIWHQQSFEFQFNSDQPFVDIVLVNNAPGGLGNDLAIDDIILKPCLAANMTLVSDNAAFTTGIQDNSENLNITTQGNNSYNSPYYILQKSTDNGNTWIILESGLNSFFTVPQGTYHDGDLFRILVSEDINQGNLNCSVIVGPEEVIINQQNTPIEIIVCDDNFDGITQISLEETYQQLISNVDVGENPLDEVYIANSYDGLIKIENVSTNANRVNVCSSEFSLYEVAIDEDQNIYVTSSSGLYLVNTQNCTYTRVGTLPPQSNVALSFDTQNNLYAGGFRHSLVYRADAGQLDNYYVWHDFEDGSSGGDFVVIGDFMYIAWAYNDDYYLFKVTMDADNQYVSHENMGSIPTDTFGLAAENGRLYGVTPDYLYEINLETLATNRIIINSSNIPWWGAAGLHEAVAFEISFHQNINDAQNGSNELGLNFTNTTPFQQTVYVRILNENTGESEIVPVNITVNIPEETQAAVLYECVPEGELTAEFTLTDALPQMTQNTGLNISFHTTQENAESGTSPINNITTYSPESLPATVYVRFENPCVSINTITLSGEAATLSLPESISFCEGESAVLTVNESFDTYTWSGLTGADITNNDVNSNQIIVTNPGTYTIEVEYGNACSLTRDIQVIQEARPAFVNQEVEFCAQGNQLDIAVSELQSELNLADPSYFYELYTSQANANAGTNALSGMITVSDGQNVVVKVKNNADSSCYALAELNVQLNPYPEFTLDENYQICEGETVQIALPNGFESYQWIGLQGEDVVNNDINSNEINIRNAGNYSVHVANENCSITKEFSIGYDASAEITSVQITGNNATIIAVGQGILEYSIDGISWSTNPNFANLPSGIYTAFVRGDEVCGITQREFSLFDITNVITPNDDGFNDVWEIKGISIYPDVRIQIYNRYGKLLIDKSPNTDIVWDGTYKGQSVPSGDYWYLISIPDGRNYSGHITIKNF